MATYKRERLVIGGRRYRRDENVETGTRWYYVIRINGRSMMLDQRHHVIKALIDAAIERREAGGEEA
ncbi:hypothetical protein [Burkholderia gladioli]|uniref:hypothetical protein n=1 Tax=Burkholderia gladioli TaxID=28095 RepID=UPI00163FFE62|nr:hypothetical protein [Burkholderia gladioli]